MGGISSGAARSDGAGFGGGSALASFDKNPLEPFTFKLVEPACFGQSARSSGCSRPTTSIQAPFREDIGEIFFYILLDA